MGHMVYFHFYFVKQETYGYHWNIHISGTKIENDFITQTHSHAK